MKFTAVQHFFYFVSNSLKSSSSQKLQSFIFFDVAHNIFIFFFFVFLDSCVVSLAVPRKAKLKHKVVTGAPPIFPLEVLEKLIIDSFGYTDVDDMYANIREYMKGENRQSKKKVFLKWKTVSDEEAVRLVAKYLMQG